MDSNLRTLTATFCFSGVLVRDGPNQRLLTCRLVFTDTGLAYAPCEMNPHERETACCGTAGGGFCPVGRLLGIIFIWALDS